MTSDSKITSDLQNSFIWAQSISVGRQSQAYVAFRKVVEFPSKPTAAKMCIFADNRYMLWINGQYVERGPCRFDPQKPEYDNLDVSQYLKPGRNVLAILVHHYAIANFEEWHQQSARMMAHEPGLTARLDATLISGNLVVKTDSTWKMCAKTGFQPSPGCYGSIVDNIDARLDHSDWTEIEFDDSTWESSIAVCGDLWGKLAIRSIPLLKETTIIPELIQETVGGERENKPQSLVDRLPLTMTAGDQLVLDIGRMVQAYSVLDFDATEGSLLEVNYVTRFFDTDRQLRTASFFSPESSGTPNSYIARAGRQVYMSGDTFGCKYVGIKVISGQITFNSIKLVDRRYPYERLGSFKCNDQMLNQLWDISVNTIEVCSEDAYVDCADRERAQWIADGYMMSFPVSCVALAVPDNSAGYRYCDPRLLKQMLRHIGLSQLPDGRMQPMIPSEYAPENKHGVIDDYNCLWVQAVREYLDRTGDEAFACELWPTLVRALDYFLDRRTERGLVNAVEFVYFNNPLAYIECEGASVNAYIYGALRDAVHVGRQLGEQDTAKRFDTAADDLYRDYNTCLWDAESGTYFGSIITGIPSGTRDIPPIYHEEYKGKIVNNNKTPATAHAALIALYYNLVPSERRQQVFNFMIEQLLTEGAFPYTYRYFLDVLFRQDIPEMDILALNTMREKFGPMTADETGTTSEVWGGDSFVHESGAHPAYFLSAYILGVRTQYTKDGLELFIEPRLGDLQMAKGVVLCEFGPISVCWEQTEENVLNFKINLPESVQACVSIPLPQLSYAPTLIIDEKTFLRSGAIVEAGKIAGRYFKVNLTEGEHLGYITPYRVSGLGR